jgi:hypothetical protein
MNIKPTPKEQRFIAGYFEAVEFTEETKQEELADCFIREQVIDCLCFFGWASAYIKEGDEDQAGYDFWLTRNGHGTGFWDRPERYGSYVAESMTKRSEWFGEAYVITIEE